MIHAIFEAVTRCLVSLEVSKIAERFDPSDEEATALE
jgi:hypothetical protein